MSRLDSGVSVEVGAHAPTTLPPQPIPRTGGGPPILLTVDEAAALLRVNRKTLYEAIRLDQIPGVVRIGRLLRIRRSALLDTPSVSAGPDLKEQK